MTKARSPLPVNQARGRAVSEAGVFGASHVRGRSGFMQRNSVYARTAWTKLRCVPATWCGVERTAFAPCGVAVACLPASRTEVAFTVSVPVSSLHTAGSPESGSIDVPAAAFYGDHRRACPGLSVPGIKAAEGIAILHLPKEDAGLGYCHGTRVSGKSTAGVLPSY